MTVFYTDSGSFGDVQITGSLIIVSGTISTPTGLTGSLSGAALSAISASYALSASYAPSTPSVSASYALTASYAPSSPSISASYALTASYAPSSPSVSASYATRASLIDFPSGLSVSGAVNVSGSDNVTVTKLDTYTDNYAQLNIQNFSNSNSASADIVATQDIGNDTFGYVNVGINSSQYTLGVVGDQSDGYMYSLSSGELHIGNAATGSNANIHLFAGGQNSHLNTRVFISSSGQVSIGANTGSQDNTAQFFVGNSGSILAGPITGSAYRVTGTGSGDGFIAFDVRDNAPDRAVSGFGRLYMRNVANKVTPSWIGPSGTPYQVQAALYNNNIQMLSTNNTTTLSAIGNSVTSAGTISHPAPAGDRLPFMSNLATGAGVGAGGGIVSASVALTNVSVSRGLSDSGSGGFLFVARLGFPDYSYTASVPTEPSGNIRMFVGLTSATMLGVSANESTSIAIGCGFQLSSPVGDTTWSFVSRDGTNLTRQTTGVPFEASQSLFDFYIYAPTSGSVVNWRIDNNYTGVIVSGTMSGTLPTPGVKMRGGWDFRGRGKAFNIRQQKIYLESDI